MQDNEQPIMFTKAFAEKVKEMNDATSRAFFFPDTIPKPAPPPAVDLNIPLLPCPFCGSADVEQEDHQSYGHGDSTSEVYVECQTCQAKGPDTGYWGGPTDEQRRKAMELWNARSPAS